MKDKIKREKKTSINSFPLNERISYLRNTRRLTQKELAVASRLSQSTIAQIESGRKDPSVKTLEKLARALDIQLAIFFMTDNVLVFDLEKLKRKYNHVDKLNPTIEQALGRIVRYSKEIGFI